MGYILVGSLTLVYKINGAKYIKVYIKHNGELNPGIIPLQCFPHSNQYLLVPKAKLLLFPTC